MQGRQFEHYVYIYTDKPENNDFIWPCMSLNDLLSQVVELVILRTTIVEVWKIISLIKMIVTFKSPTRLHLQKTRFDWTMSSSKPNKLP